MQIDDAVHSRNIEIINLFIASVVTDHPLVTGRISTCIDEAVAYGVIATCGRRRTEDLLKIFGCGGIDTREGDVEESAKGVSKTCARGEDDGVVGR